MTRVSAIIILLLMPVYLFAQKRIVVDPAGRGDFRTIQQALQSLPDSSATDRLVFIKNGTYKEQLLIKKNHIIFQGESRTGTVISGSISHLIYSCQHPGDKNSAVMNIDGNDITLRDLTVENTYGRDAPDSLFIDCANATTGKMEKIKVPKTAHQFTIKTAGATRLKVVNCVVLSYGQDTVSPWSGTGMYYFKGCTLVGGTDFYCPRGWAYAENCTFIVNVPGAIAIWHDGSKGRDIKSVFRNCTFKGEQHFQLGRYHHEASFYLIDCHFDKTMEDKPIYKAETAKPMLWESTVYYYNARTDGPKFGWLKDNLDQAPGAPKAEAVTARWTFNGKWNP